MDRRLHGERKNSIILMKCCMHFSNGVLPWRLITTCSASPSLPLSFVIAVFYNPLSASNWYAEVS
jgi:hypothetical protein